MNPKQMGRFGLFHIGEAILEALSEEPKGLRPEHINKAIGIRKYTDYQTNRAADD